MPIKILLVDDTKLFLELEKNFLRLSPVRVLTAGNGKEALEIARKERPDLIYMDLHMPLMDGAATCAALKADPALRTIPVIMVTSAGKEEDIQLCRESGCDDFLTKPVNRRLFLEKGRKFIDGIDRRELRVLCRTSVKFKVHNLTLSGVSTDISTGGIYIAAEYDIEPKTMLDLSISLPETGCVLQGIKGRIAWQNNGNTIVKPEMPQGFGVEFIDLQKEIADVIATYIDISKRH